MMIFMRNWRKVHSVVHNKTYDFNPEDWIKNMFNLHYGKIQQTNSFVCSALVSFVYACLGVLPENTDWCLIRPCDFSSWKKGTRIECVNQFLDGNINLRD